ncbi:MAG: hypothetical protein Q4F18_02040 [Clostridia bacterium]|nr:hypothetical protein [Clostridia bacterium]
MTVSIIIALILSICMSTTAIIWDKLTFSIELLLRNWGTAFLTIMLISLLLPVKMMGDTFSGRLGLKPDTLPFGLVSNLIPTLFYNTGATLILVGVNVGFSAPYYWQAFRADFGIMFVVSYVLSLIAERIGMIVAKKACQPIHPHL